MVEPTVLPVVRIEREKPGMNELADRIEKAIATIPARNPMYIAAQNETLRDMLSKPCLRKIAEVAAAEAMKSESQ